jgi:exosortase/archaeosortase family protein
MELDGRTVLVDAPCSGVRMGWTACVLCCVLAAQRTRTTWLGLGGSLILALPVVLLANAARAAMLFVFEVSPSPPSAAGHAMVGIATFAFVALGLLASERMQQRWPARPAPLAEAA